MRYAGLRFFNGTKTELELSYNSDKELFEGSMYLDEVSTGLYETATIFILEETISQYGVQKLVKPIASQTGSKFKCEFSKSKSESKDIKLISAYLESGEMYVKEDDSLELDVQDNSVAISTTDGIHTLGSSYAKDALQFTIALKSEDDKPHYRYLKIYDTIDDHLIANIYVYGETVGEDERLAVLLSNFGTSLTAKDQFLFKDHDINEIGTDWKLINRKRKELLLEMSNIRPFIGTYKALINAIKFFGYNNLTLKEYWLMIDDRSPMFGKMKALEVPFGDSGFAAKNKEVLLPSSSYKKTSRFGLFYKLNTPNGQFDEWDTPQVEEVFDFTPEEVLIKLYGLKNKLQKEYLPMQAKIIDIIGEADFYNAYNINIWNNQNTITNITHGIDVTIKANTDTVYIEDLEKVSTILNGGVQDFSSLSPADAIQLYSDIEDFYTNYYNIDRNTFKSGGVDNKIGAPVLLECTSFKDTWDGADFTWNDAESYITVDNWWHRNIYEIRWTITGPKGYNQVITGGLPYLDPVVIDDYRKIALALPYAGSYDVKVELIDLFNNVSVDRIENAIEVKVKPVEFYGLYRWKDVQDFMWGKSAYSWKDAGGDWEFPQQNRDDVENEIASLYLSLDRANYLNDDSQGVNFSMVRRYQDTASSTGYSETTGPYYWRNLNKHNWNDGQHTWWDATRVGSDLAAAFTIVSADLNSELEISYYDYDTDQTYVGFESINYDLNDPNIYGSFERVADDLNNSTNPIISKFNYNPILVDIDNDGNHDRCIGILAVGKNYSTSYDFETVSIINGAGLIEPQNHYKAYNPTYNDVKIARDHATVEKLTHMTFSADNSKMAGKLAYRWKIRNNSTNVGDIYYNNKWLTYLFDSKGDYTIELEITDINGNTNKVTKNALTIK